MKNILTASILFATTALGLSACGPAVPENPTWEHDIRPLMVARCIRCHDGEGHTDPETSKLLPKTPAISALFNFNYKTFDELKANTLSFTYIKAAPMYVRAGAGAIPIMPPPPAETLEQWEIDMLVKWVANPR